MVKRKPTTDPPWELSELEKKRIAKFIVEKYPQFSRNKKGALMWEQCRDWHLSNGVQRANWEATFRNWVRKQAEFKQAEGHRQNREMPQEYGQRSERFVTVGNLFETALESVKNKGSA